MIWTYVISIVLALIWFLVFRYLTFRPRRGTSEYEYVTMSRGMILLSIVLLLIPIINILYFIIAPFVFINRLDEESYGLEFKARENDAFSETIKNIVSWLKDSAF